MSNRVNDAEHVFGAMVDPPHEKVLLFLALLALLALGGVRDGADDACAASLTPFALEISKPMGLHPADLAISPPEPELDRVGLRIDRIERRLSGRPKQFRVVWMHALPISSTGVSSAVTSKISRDRASPENTR